MKEKVSNPNIPNASGCICGRYLTARESEYRSKDVNVTVYPEARNESSWRLGDATQRIQSPPDGGICPRLTKMSESTEVLGKE